MRIAKRPESLNAVARLSESDEQFGRNLADFEHELVRLGSRRALSESIGEAPRSLAGVFATGAVADAWLAAYAEELAFRFDLDYPDWIWQRGRFLDTPYIHDAHSRRLKVWHTLKSPPSFTRRNVFVDFHLPPIQLRRGRPRQSVEHKRAMNRRRVARYRAAKRSGGA